MRQNGTDLVCCCATGGGGGGAGQGGWCRRRKKGRTRKGGAGVCHLSPCTRLAWQSLEWRGVEGARALLVWRNGEWVEVGVDAGGGDKAVNESRYFQESFFSG